MTLRMKTARLVAALGSSVVLGMAALTAAPVQATAQHSGQVVQPLAQTATAGTAATCGTIDSWTGLRPSPYATSIELLRCGTNSWKAGSFQPRKGDQLYLRSAQGTITRLTNVPVNTYWYETTTVGTFGAPWQACIKMPNVSEKCTRRMR